MKSANLRAFTMIELVFIIVILGILAAVAIPRLAATRDDASVAAGLTNASSIVTDVVAYYTSQGKAQSSVGLMTNVKLEATGGLKVGNKQCLKFSITADSDALLVEKLTDDGICAKFNSEAIIKSYLLSDSPKHTHEDGKGYIGLGEGVSMLSGS